MAIIVAFGANLSSSVGTPGETYQKLPEILKGHGIDVVRASSLHVSAPVPVSDQPDYRNAVLLVESTLSANDLLLTLMRVEEALGRLRTVKNAARGVDLDLIAYGDEVSGGDVLCLPHPRMHQRLFVLLPLQEILPDWVHPVFKKSVNELIKVL